MHRAVPPVVVVLLGGLASIGPAAAGLAPHAAHPGDRIAVVDSLRRFDANVLDLYSTNDGVIGFDRASGNSGLQFPRDSGKAVMFAGGLWVAARVAGATRVTVGEYSSEWQPGRIVGGLPEPPGPAALRNWKVRTLQGFRVDSDSIFVAGVPPADVVAHESWSDYRVLAAPTGAPTGSNPIVLPLGSGAGTLPGPGPLLPGDLALWSVFNDANAARHTNNAGETPPLGLEVRQTVFGFDTTPASTAFVRWTLVHRGTSALDSAVVTFWVDPDLGGASDDLVGWDAPRQMGYAYNADNDDNVYTTRPPAFGVRYLSGPDGSRAGSFNKYIGGTDPASAIETDRLMRGFKHDGSPWIDPRTGLGTRFPFPGDPIGQGGWRDSLPSDRRFLVSTPPFHLAPGDSATFLFALVVGQGDERLDSIARLRCQAELFDSTFTGFSRIYPSRLALLDAESSSHDIHFLWSVEGENFRPLLLRRHFGTSVEWPEDDEGVAQIDQFHSPGRIGYSGDPLPPGQRWTYGLFDPCDPFRPLARVVLDGVGGAIEFRVTSPVTNGPLTLFLTLQAGTTARLEAFSVAGRRMLGRDLAAPVDRPGTTVVAESEAWPTGLYFLRLTQAGEVLTRRAVIVR